MALPEALEPVLEGGGSGAHAAPDDGHQAPARGQEVEGLFDMLRPHHRVMAALLGG